MADRGSVALGHVPVDQTRHVLRSRSYQGDVISSFVYYANLRQINSIKQTTLVT